jgi:hypothetical protein
MIWSELFMKKNLKRACLYLMFIAITFYITGSFNYAAVIQDSTIQNPDYISDVTYKLKSNVYEINMKDIGLSDSTILNIKNKTQEQYTANVNNILKVNGIYLDKTLNISIKVISAVSKYSKYEIVFEIPKLSEVFDNLEIPEQNIGIKEEHVVKDSIPDNIEYSAKKVEDFGEGDIHNFEFDDYTVPGSDIKINGTVILSTPKILTEFKWNENFKIVLSTGQEVDINMSGNWNFESDVKKMLLSDIEVLSNDGIGKLYAGLYVSINSNGNMDFSVDIEQDLNCSTSIEGDLKYGVDPLNVETGYKIDKNLAVQINNGNITNSYFPIELFASLDILGQEIKIVCTMGVEVNSSKSDNYLYLDIDGRCIGNAYIFGKTFKIFDKRWDIYDYKIPLPVIVSFTASRTNISKYQNTILSWKTENAVDISITSSRGVSVYDLDESGSLMVTPNSSVTFILKAVNEYGMYVTKEIRVTVN